MKYAVRIRAKRGGDEICLGVVYATREEASAYVAAEVCQRCYYTAIYSIADDAVWVNRSIGFRQKADAEWLRARGIE